MPLKNETINILNVRDSLNMNNKVISNLGEPHNDTDAVNKKYVDETVLLNNSEALIQVGGGLKKGENNVVTLDGPVSVSFGGTGVDKFDRGVLVLGNDNSPLTSTANLKWDFQTSTLHLPNAKLSICNTEDVRSRRCSTETLSSVNLGSQKAMITNLSSDKLHSKHVVADRLEAMNFVKHYQKKNVNNKAGVKLTPSQLLTCFVIRNDQQPDSKDQLPSASELIKELEQMDCASCGTVLSAYYQNESKNNITLVSPYNEEHLVESGQCVELTLLVTNVTKGQEKYKVFYRN